MPVGSAQTETDLANMALTMIGQQVITAISEDSNRAVMCNKRLGDVRDTVLRSHPWNCASKRASLSDSGVDPAWGFTQSYTLPTDFVRLIATDSPDEPYQIEAGNQGGSNAVVLMTDAGSMKIKYIYKLTDVTKMDYSLQQAIACRLAHEICMPLTGDINLSNMMLQKYDAIIKEAQFTDSSAMAAYDKLQPVDWLTARLTDATHRPFPTLNSDGSVAG